MARGDPVEFVREPGIRVWNRIQLEDIYGQDIGFAHLDAFGRQRVGEPYTLFDSKQIWNDPDLADNVENFPLFWDNQQLSGGGTTTAFNVNRASTTLGVTANTAGRRTRQTKQRFNYQPGKSQIVIFTCIDLATTVGNTKRIGLFDDNNGLFFQSQDSVVSVVRRSYATGAAVNTAIARANWNLDTMDGDGPSGVNLDFTVCQIPFIDFEWLGVGRVRFGWFVDGLPIYCHELLNTNNLNVVYMSTPNLPVRAEIVNDGTGMADTFELICATVISEGGSNEQGVIRSGNLGTLAASAIQTNVIGTTYAVCGIRLKAAYLSAHIHEIKVSIVEIATAAANAPFLWRLHLNPTLTAGLTYSDVAQSAVQFGVGLAAGDVITNPGYVIQSGYASGADQHADVDLESALRLGATIAGVSDQFVLSASPASVNQDILGGITWREAW